MTGRLTAISKIIFAPLLLSALVSANGQPHVPLYSIHELKFVGPDCEPLHKPAADIELVTLWHHQSGEPSYRIYGFWDGDGKGNPAGNVFKVRFCPTKPGNWTLIRTTSNDPSLNTQHEGYTLDCTQSSLKGFWIPDEQTAGRWYRRSDGSHQYIVGNTMYSFLSEHDDKGPTGGNIADDIRANSRYFKKVRFSIMPDRYPHPNEKPFLDDSGTPTDDGNFSGRPNPSWFHRRVDLAVSTALENDLIADLILNGPDTEESRSVLQASRNNGDCTALLKYVAARYGSYPNVWICLANEFDIKRPSYSPQQIARFGQTIRQFLPYATPLSVHAKPRDWYRELNTNPPWHDHVILQNKIKKLHIAADLIAANYPLGPNKPVIDDELAYEGAGDGWSEADVIESHLGAFLGGGYGTTGQKPAQKRGHYFFGNFKPNEHLSADNLLWLRQVIDQDITFWQMTPADDPNKKDSKTGIFDNIDPEFRAMHWLDHQYVLGTNKARAGIRANLPAGKWTVTCYDAIAKTSSQLASNAEGIFSFDASDSRAALFIFIKAI